MTGSHLRVCAVLFSLVVTFSSLVVAENVKIEGFIIRNDGDQMTVSSEAAQNLLLC